MQFLLESLGVFFLFLIACIVLVILVIVVIIILLFRSIPSINALNQEVSDYIEKIIRTITDQWELQKLVQNATPKLIDLIDTNQLQAYSELCKRDLGQLTLYKVAKGSFQGLPALNILAPFMRLIAKKADLEASKNLLLAEFTSESDFEKGKAKFEFELLNRGEGWLINSLIITIINSVESEIKTLTFGEKTSFVTLVDENKRRLELEALL